MRVTENAAQDCTPAFAVMALQPLLLQAGSLALNPPPQDLSRGEGWIQAQGTALQRGRSSVTPWKLSSNTDMAQTGRRGGCRSAAP